jgi:hypothetical protein
MRPYHAPLVFGAILVATLSIAGLVAVPAKAQAATGGYNNPSSEVFGYMRLPNANDRMTNLAIEQDRQKRKADGYGPGNTYIGTMNVDNSSCVAYASGGEQAQQGGLGNDQVINHRGDNVAICNDITTKAINVNKY